VFVGDREFGRTSWREDEIEFPAQRHFCDAAGAFHAVGLVPGTLAISAVAKGFAPKTRSVTVPERGSCDVEFRLLRGVVVSGIVRDATGNPVVHANVTADQSEMDPFRHVPTSSAADGSYRLENLTPGTLSVSATAEGKGSAGKGFAPKPGEHVTWDPVLALKGTIEGRVVGADNQPLHRWKLHARAGERYAAEARTDKSGRFVLSGLVESAYRSDLNQMAYRLEARDGDRDFGPPAAILEAVPVGARDVVLVVPDAMKPSACFEGSVAASGTLAPDDVEVRVFHGQNQVKSASGIQGRFEVGPLMPATYRVRIVSKSHVTVDLGERTLDANQRLDLGETELRLGGTVAVSFFREGGARLSSPSVRAVAQGIDSSFRRIGDRLLRSEPLPPGKYEIHYSAAGTCPGITEAEVRFGEQTRLEIPLRRGTSCTLRFNKPAGHPDIKRLRVRLSSVAGERVFDGEVPQSSDTRDLLGVGMFLGFGSWRLEVTTDTGLSAKGTFEVTDQRSTDEERTFFFDLR
jgi:hypothetical protein